MIGKENTSLEATRDEQPFSESHKEPDLAFLEIVAALNLLENLLGKVITLPTLGFSKLLLRTLKELSLQSQHQHSSFSKRCFRS